MISIYFYLISNILWIPLEPLPLKSENICVFLSFPRTFRKRFTAEDTPGDGSIFSHLQVGDLLETTKTSIYSYGHGY